MRLTSVLRACGLLRRPPSYSSAQAFNVSITPDQDCRINAGSGADTPGNSYLRSTNRFQVDNATYKAPLQIDLTSIPTNATIVAATLNLYKYTGLSTARVRGINNESDDTFWTDGSATWNNLPNHETGSATVCWINGETIYDTITTGGSAAEWMSFDVRQWVEDRKGDQYCSIMVAAANGSGGSSPRFRETEYGTASFRPYLEIDYTA